MTAQRRRDILLAAAAASAGGLLVRPARAADISDELAVVVAAFAQGATPRSGRVRLDVAELVDNGNAVPIHVSVDSPMSAQDHVTEIAVFNERNPQRDVLRARLTPANGRASVATRIRLATSQKLVALARMSDGSVWSHTVEVVVTLAACIEDTL